jgi:hypothetical protein
VCGSPELSEMILLEVTLHVSFKLEFDPKGGTKSGAEPLGRYNEGYGVLGKLEKQAWYINTTP